ncbi:predicted protein [Chaetoceros tenuissimus]|uniref:Uncharacterized protein n=1 Tax=Chaetoceros tenuissimus TaxID=426638 RepID=A0AAD3DE79_9STRA|nr:predicted protein [Chaetoceros tenuissimus]
MNISPSFFESRTTPISKHIRPSNTLNDDSRRMNHIGRINEENERVTAMYWSSSISQEHSIARRPRQASRTMDSARCSASTTTSSISRSNGENHYSSITIEPDILSILTAAYEKLEK